MYIQMKIVPRRRRSDARECHVMCGELASLSGSEGPVKSSQADELKSSAGFSNRLEYHSLFVGSL